MADDIATQCSQAIKGLLDIEPLRTMAPATDADIAQLQTAIGLTVPPTLDAWLRLINGLYGVCICDGWAFLSTTECAMHWEFFSNPVNAMAPLVEQTDHPQRVRVPANHATRIAVAADYSGNLLVIDMDPVQPEHIGQVLYVTRDPNGGAWVVFDSFDHLLSTVTADIASGNLTIVDGATRFTANRGIMRRLYELGRAYREPAWHPADDAEAFVAALTPEQRSACYVAQNDLLQTDMFPAADLDLVRSIVLTPELCGDVDWLAGFPALATIRIAGNPTPHTYEVLARLPLVDLNIQATSTDGYVGFEALRAHPTLQVMSAFQANQAVFDVSTTMPHLKRLQMIGSRIDNLSSVSALGKLASLNINDTGTPDPAPAYAHPTLREFALSWRRPVP
jgi:cell wall assembly regulator SMI1